MKQSVLLFSICISFGLIGYFSGSMNKNKELIQQQSYFDAKIKFQNDLIAEQMDIINQIRLQRDSLISKSQNLSLNLLETIEVIDKLSKSKPNIETKLKAEKWIDEYNLLLQ